ncbi:MAG: hypothetical protein ACR2LK_09830 [Solirubrobacteraceae bacterium]
MAYHGLDTYLNDHLAGATAGLNLAEAAADEHKQDEHGLFFGEIASDIKADFATLESLMGDLAVDKSATKTAAAEIGSKVMKPKFTGDDDDLNAFVTLETLSIGIEGKCCMWKALRTVADGYPALGSLDIDDLIARAEDQRSRIEAKRLEVSPNALAHSAPV